jgi:hypothetical protein
MPLYPRTSCALDSNACSITGAEVVQLHLLLRRELDGILGRRSWHKDSPPEQAQVRRMVLCQDLAHRQLATYFLRAVLRKG